MLEFFSFLLTLGTALKVIFDELNKSEQKKLARKIHQIHVQLQSIIDSAERIFDFIKNIDGYIDEYGEDKFIRIIRHNFESQFTKLINLSEALQEPGLIDVFKKLNGNLQKRLSQIVHFKGDSIRLAIQKITFFTLLVQNGEIFIKEYRNKKILAFPELDNEIGRVLELKRCSKEFGQSIYSAVDLEDLL